MPIYEYRRPDGSTFEIVQSFSDDPLTHDPDTGVPVQRVLHPPAVHFKGSGFYNTDYGTRKRQRETASSSSGDDGASAKKDSADGGSFAAKTESKDKPGSGAPSVAKSSDAKPVTASS